MNKKYQHPEKVIQLFEKKRLFFENVIQKTILYAQKIKILDVLGTREINKCIQLLHELDDSLKDLIEKKNDITTERLITSLQEINNDLSAIFKQYGTESLDDLLIICFGPNAIDDNIYKNEELEILRNFFHPISYISFTSSSSVSTSPQPEYEKEDSSLNSYIMECTEISHSTKKFHLKVYGANIIIFEKSTKKSLSIIGFFDDIVLENAFMKKKLELVIHNKSHPNENPLDTNNSFEKFKESLMLKDLLINNLHDIQNKYQGYMSHVKLIKQKPLSHVVKEFIDMDLFNKRLLLIELLLCEETTCMAYLLYDILSNDQNNGSIDTEEQIILYDSFPWTVKQLFSYSMKKMIEYTNQLSNANFDINKVPLEQQICLMNTTDIVKEKAMTRLKEVKSKSEDSGSKARQYLEGLLKIPFGIYKREEILDTMNNIRKEFKDLLRINGDVSIKDYYTSAEILWHITHSFDFSPSNDGIILELNANKSNRVFLTREAKKVNTYIKEHKLNNCEKIKYINKKSVNELKECIETFYKKTKQSHVPVNADTHSILHNKYSTIYSKMNSIHSYFKNVKQILDKSVYGHEKAKKQIERIIGQWINGEQTGHCFGFEGPPGVGKTSLAKYGLSHCLIDDQGNHRPFAMIQIGGDSNGSTLHGHNYTYVGSTWGSIVQILMDKKCMNPIIFIDEVDKISKTENGKEMIGILTHLLDPTQNDCFQDKYFNGVDLDLSKALFVLSYNDVDMIDKILLDRIHRIKFSSLSCEEKVVVSQKYILPDVFTKMGLTGTIEFPDDVIRFIVNEYTSESGVRKLKELFFEIVGEMNLEILNKFCDIDSDLDASFETNIHNSTLIPIHIPIKMTISDVKKYLREKHEIKIKQIHSSPAIGVINGMYATSVGSGGILPISANFYPSSSDFLTLKLTGLQQEVMKESMHLALTIAWNMTGVERQLELRNKYDTNNRCGINIHAGDLDVQKEGPSAGIAITSAIYSLLNNILIKNDVAITGEIFMSGDVGAIGGLDYKILGSLKSNIKTFVFPQENEKDYKDFIEKYKDTEILKEKDDLCFYPVKNIEEVFKIVFLENK